MAKTQPVRELLQSISDASEGVLKFEEHIRSMDTQFNFNNYPNGMHEITLTLDSKHLVKGNHMAFTLGAWPPERRGAKVEKPAGMGKLIIYRVRSPRPLDA